MKQFFVENYNILKNAIGVEPPKQIFMNAIRKVVGLPPKHIAIKRDCQEYKQLSPSKYQDYLLKRNIYFANHNSNKDHNYGIDLIWLLEGEEDSLFKTWESICNQKIKFSSIIVVAKKDREFPFVGIDRRFSTIEDACHNCFNEYVFFLKGDSLLHSAFVQECKMQIASNQEADFFYTCDDFVAADSLEPTPRFKPQFNKYLLYNKNYIGQNLLVKRTFGGGLNWLNDEFKSAFMYDFILRGIDNNAKIVRIDEILIHHMKPVLAEDIEERKIALKRHLLRNKDFAQVNDGIEAETTRLVRAISKSKRVSIIIPFRDKLELLQQCLESILSKTLYKNYEIILANNNSTKEETLTYLDQIRKEHKDLYIVDINIPFNFSKINNIASQSAEGDYLLFLNNDTQVINEGWLSSMVSELEKEDVGAVGAKLLYEDNTVQHAGVILGVGHIAGHAFRNFNETRIEEYNRVNVIQEYLAVTGACMLTKASLFKQVNGFDEVNLKVAYNDIDYCLELNKLGYKIIYTPFASLYHFESKSRKNDLSQSEMARYESECNHMKTKWKKILEIDPFFHPHLDTRYENFRELKEIA